MQPLPGFGELFRMLSWDKIASGAMLSRAVGGIASGKLIFSMPGSTKAVRDFLTSCTACQLPGGLDARNVAERMFMVMLQDFMDPWTFNQKNLMKCCKEFLLPGGKQIPFCAYNTIGYREQARIQLEAMEPERRRSRAAGQKYEPRPIVFSFSEGTRS